MATKPKFNVKKVDGGDSQIGYFVNTAKSTLLSIPGMTKDLAKVTATRDTSCISAIDHD